MADKTSTSLFQRLRPVCVNVTKDCSIQSLNEALAAFKSLKKCDINEVAMLEYILFPFRITLQKRKVMKEDQEILCFTCLQVIFSKCQSSVIKDEVVSWCLNTFSLYFVSADPTNDKPKGMTMKDVSEERKVSVVKFIQSLLSNLNSATMLTVFGDKCLPVLGHIVSILLDMIEMERHRELQIAALKCLKTLSGSAFKDAEFIELAGKCWASFLPGVCMTFHRLFTKNDRIGQNLLASSLDVFAHVISIVLNDNVNKDLIETKEMSLEDLLGPKPKMNNNEKITMCGETKSIGVSRTKDWLQSTCSNLNLIFKNIFPVIICHFKVKVQLALLVFVEKLLISCMNTLSLSIMAFLDVLLKYSCDDCEEVRIESHRILDSSMKRFHDSNVTSIKSALTERLYEELLSLPRIMHSSNDNLKLAKLQTIKGYMEFYGNHMCETLNTFSLLQRFVMSLVHVLELETDNVNIVEEQTSFFRQAIDTAPETYDNRFYRKNFKMFRTISIYNVIKDIIHLMAKYGSVEILIDFLLEQRENFLTCKQSFLILNEILLGMDTSDVDLTNSFVDSVLTAYIDDDFMKLPVSNKYIQVEKDEHLLYEEGLITKQYTSLDANSNRDTFPFEVLNSNIQLICILLEGVSNCAHVLKTEFNIWMIQVLYVLLEKVGFTNAAISLTAIETLNNLVRFCDYKDISHLIFTNSDYLLNSITLQFRRITYNSAAPAVLCVVLRFCDSSLIPIISDVIGEVFNVLDEYQEEVADDLLTVLKHYNMAVAECYAASEQSKGTLKTSTKESGEKKITDIANDDVSVSDFLAEYSKLTLHSQGIIDEEEYNENEDDVGENADDFLNEELNSEGDTEGKKAEEIPFHYKIVISSLEKCVSFAAASRNNIKSKALEVVFHGVAALKQRENDLLPLIHKLWPPIILRLKDKDPMLALKAFDVVCSMVDYSGNFITKRMTTDFIPYAVKHLQNSFLMLTRNQYNFTQQCKIVKKLISFLWNIIPTLDVSTEMFCNVTSAIFIYTSQNTHSSIQENAVSALHQLYLHRPNVIWLYIFGYVSADWSAPYNVLTPLSYDKITKATDEHRKNMSVLLCQLNVKKKDVIFELEKS